MNAPMTGRQTLFRIVGTFGQDPSLILCTNCARTCRIQQDRVSFDREAVFPKC